MGEGASPNLIERLGAAMYDPTLAWGERRGMDRRRDELLAEARGRVLEIGAGTGLNLAHYPSEIEELLLAEPDPGMAARLERRVAEVRPEARILHTGAEDLPLEDESIDTVVSTLVLCTVGDPRRSLEEIARVLRPGGRFLFVEHVRSDSPRLAAWQDRLRAPWAAFASGCRCNQDTVEIVRESPLRLETSGPEHWSGMPPIVRPLAVGAATKEAGAQPAA